MEKTLNQLIAELCPDGVERKAIKDCVQKNQKFNWEDKVDVKYIDLSSLENTSLGITSHEVIHKDNAPSRAQYGASEGDIIFATTRPYQNKVTIITSDYDASVVSTGYCVMRTNSNILNNRFLLYVLQSPDIRTLVIAKQKGASYPAISNGELLNLRIPVPPLPVQEEIVRILDTMSTLTATLTAEKEARKKQYAYYRDVLLTFGEDIPHCSLSSLVIKTGKVNWNESTNLHYIDLSSLESGSLTKEKCTIVTNGNAPSRAQNIVHSGDVIFATTRPYQNKVALIPNTLDGAVASTGYCVMRVNEQKINSSFLLHMLRTTKVKDFILSRQKGTSYPTISNKDLLSLTIPVPPLHVQEEIVSILDKLSDLAEGVDIGLPREIELAQKQYEYYLAKLLDFPEA